ncbi:MAG TPA: CDP-diacylglycerol--glycerol-3-phosphate 3-phosphatidyltransferase [Candidatus Cloacimonas sp.]|nr:MAG: CDP-diacylglycerol--glycerol-3-phosphate 3-phosphatidyltransferase [Candidatus Cloacimonetes bacterium ADurb.Bin089]HPB19079.1 CDP-diacylglycerol--glycerol-3-phosphate 3-phosphatidyltransferase [Candidatus Cloacimonas sp.]HQO17756.1 CDP-diacylglycerol--glycerol-3-phosphate 3-phosphatidyltransferase [Candidatus Cloacimonas sp.]
MPNTKNLKMIRHLPNYLTVFRILLVPIFLYFLFLSAIPARILIALLIFVIAAITDYLDGMLARKMNLISDFGKLMDPLADKLIVLSALAGLCWLLPFQISIAVFFIILARELTITILREIYQKKGIVVAADFFGKLKTVLQMAGIIVAYGFWAFINPVPQLIIHSVNIWFWFVALITVLSGLNYIIAIAKKD